MRHCQNLLGLTKYSTYLIIFHGTINYRLTGIVNELGLGYMFIRRFSIDGIISKGCSGGIMITVISSVTTVTGVAAAFICIMPGPLTIITILVI